MTVAFILSAVCVAVDQLTKWFLYGKSCSLIGDFLWLEPGFNTGASFSILSNATLFLIIFSIPVIALMIYFIISNKVSKSKFFKIALGIILGGTIGNLIDRIAFGGVRDFIYFKSINFAIFNFADIFINIGVYLLVGFIIYSAVKEFKKSKVTIENCGETVNVDSENVVDENKTFEGHNTVQEIKEQKADEKQNLKKKNKSN